MTNLRPESVDIHLRNTDTSIEVVQARCVNGAIPCTRTFVERLRLTNGVWSEIAEVATPPTNLLAQCDMFINFKARWASDTPTMLFATHAPCSSPMPIVRSLEGSGSGGAWIDLAPNVLGTIPAPDSEEYHADLAIGSTGLVYGLITSNERLMMVTYGAGAPTWSPPIADSVPTSPTDYMMWFWHPRIFVTANDQPVVVYNIGGETHLWRLNGP